MDIAVHVVHVLVTLGLIVLILLQQGKGADAGASFGGGASQTVFGSSGSANFLTRTTAILAVLFFVTSMTLAWMARHQSGTGSVLPALPQSEVSQPAADNAPATAPAQPQADSPAATGTSDIPQVPSGSGEKTSGGEKAGESAKTSQKEGSEVPSAGVESSAPTETPSRSK